VARPKEFDRDAALERARDVFWSLGYEATTMESLVRGMGIGRQSLYDTFGDKHSLFVAALDAYRERAGRELSSLLGEAVSPLDAIRCIFRSVAEEPESARTRGCMMLNAIVEHGPRDPEIARIVAANRRAFEESIRSALVRAKALDELPDGADPERLSRYLLASLQGLRVAAKANPDPAYVSDVAELMLKVLER
jgi:TetR/AcrR family transcriptional repressor of nem operon